MARAHVRGKGGLPRDGDPDSWRPEEHKDVIRFLAHRPRLVWKYDFQPMPSEITVFSDVNWANCSKSRKSTSGGYIMLGSHLLRAWSKTQAMIALSSGESETLAAIRGGTEALGMLSLMHDLGAELTSTLRLDASAALGIFAA